MLWECKNFSAEFFQVNWNVWYVGIIFCIKCVGICTYGNIGYTMYTTGTTTYK